jgi:hypothetical protein
VLTRRSIYDLPTALIGALSLAVLMKWKVPQPLIIVVTAVAGLALKHGSWLIPRMIDF